jgi:hypothetical protein
MMVAYMQQLNAVVKWLQDQVNHGAGYLNGLVEDLIYQNFDPATVKECPQIVFSPISPADMLDNMTLLGDLTKAGVLPRHLKITNYVLDRLGAPTLSQAEFDDAVGPRSVVDVGTPSGNPEAGQPGAPISPAPPTPAVPSKGGRPTSATPTDANSPRKDKLGRAFGLADEKKTPCDDNPPLTNLASWPWLRSKPDSTTTRSDTPTN